MNRFQVDKLKPGMRFSKPVYIDQNNMLVGANVAIRDGDIKRLLKWGIREILSDGMPIDDIQTTISAIKDDGADLGQIFSDYNKLIAMREEIERVHLDAYNAVLKTHNAIRNNRLFATTDLERAVEGIISILNKNRNAFLFMYNDDREWDPLVLHATNTTYYAVLIAMSMKYTKPRLVELALGTLMINAGMIQIPIYITHKQSQLTEHEVNQVKTHPILGYQAMKKFGNFSERSSIIVLQHHEQFDGNGYPRGLKGMEIDEGARIATIADNYEAVLEGRSYREKQFFYQSMKQLVSLGARKFDTVLLKAFISILSVYPIGSIVELNKGGVGIVIGSNPQKPMRPIVKLILTESKQQVRDLVIVNLATDQSLYISRILDEKESGISVTDAL
ncbi:MAG TPA: HD domain-containing phosphohydrolase [Spirochaetota bacterium]